MAGGIGGVMLGPQQLIFKVVHFLIAVIMMQNQRQVAAEDAYSGCKSRGVSVRAALPRLAGIGQSLSARTRFAYNPLFSFKARQFYLRLLSRVRCFSIQARCNNKWSAQIKSVVALSIFQAGHAFLFIQRVKASRPPPPLTPLPTIPHLLTIISFHLKNECACQGFFSSLSSCSEPPAPTHPSWLAPAITGGDSRGR